MKSLAESLFDNETSQMTMESLFDNDLISKNPISWKDMYDFLLEHIGEQINKNKWAKWLNKLNNIIDNLKQFEFQYEYQLVSIPKNKLYLSIDIANQYLYILECDSELSYTPPKILRFGILKVFGLLKYQIIDIDDITQNGRNKFNGGMISLNSKELKEFDRFISNLTGGER